MKTKAAARPSMVGKPIWHFDQNRRVYRKQADGRSTWGAPIWREHWVEMSVIGETPRSWLVGGMPRDGRIATKVLHKLPKASMSTQWAWDTAGIDDRGYVVENIGRISNAVMHIGDVEILRKIAALIQYVPRPSAPVGGE